MVARRYGWQPLNEILWRRNDNVRAFARRAGFNPDYASRVGQGGVRPSSAFRAALSNYLGLPVEDLFTPVALAKDYYDRIDGTSERLPGFESDE